MTNAVSSTNLNRRRCLRIGRALLDGPSAIFPPASLDDYGWLEAEFRLTVKWPGNHMHESLQVFCDDSMNRDENFLAPMIRRCVWNRSADMANTNPWPSATVEIGSIRNNSRVDTILRDVQRTLSILPFAEHGLSLRRDVADIEIDSTEPEFRVWARNGVQSIEYWSVPVAAASLGLSFSQIHAELLSEMAAISPTTGWRERYDCDLREEPRASWELEVGANPTLQPTAFGRG